MVMFWVMLILIFLYLVTGLIAHCVSIYNFFTDDEKEDKYEAYKKKKLNG